MKTNTHRIPEQHEVFSSLKKIQINIKTQSFELRKTNKLTANGKKYKNLTFIYIKLK